MEKEEIIIDNTIEIEGLKIIPVIQVNSYLFSKRKRISAFCSKKPLFVVIVKKFEIKAFDMNGTLIEIEELVKVVPELKEVI